jgi:hypothetical protein
MTAAIFKAFKETLGTHSVSTMGLIDTPNGRWFAYLFRDYGV